MRPARVWYVAYGSNMSKARFSRYLTGGITEAGARDSTPPKSSEWARAPLRLSFAKESQRWDGGGVAFVDDDPQGDTIVRAWDISAEQFEDVFAQENRVDVGGALDWGDLTSGSLEVGSGWYRRVQQVDLGVATAAQPAVTFTWSTPTPQTVPNTDYLAVMRSGLTENVSLDPITIDDYLARHTMIGR